MANILFARMECILEDADCAKLKRATCVRGRACAS